MPGTPSSPASPLPPVVVERPDVTLPAPQLKLLPFDVRLRKVAAAVGVPVADPLFDAVRAQRLQLGGHDFANGVAPDLAWNAQRMALWLEVMVPVCADARVRTHFGEWRAQGLEKFAVEAWGRPVTQADKDDLAPTLAIAGDTGWRATCAALLSSVELLAQ